MGRGFVFRLYENGVCGVLCKTSLPYNTVGRAETVKYLAYIHALQHGLYFFYGDADVVTHGSILAAGDKVVTAVYRNQNLEGFACADGSSDSGSDFPQKGVGEYDTDRPHDQIGIGRIDHDRIVSGGSMVGACLEHGGGGDAVGADGIQFQFRMLFLDLFDDRFSNTAALAVDDCDFHFLPHFCTAFSA